METADLAVSDLLLDAANPRLPEGLGDVDQESLIAFMEAEYDVLTVAKSIAEHGYFQSEPLIVVVEDGENVVVEGNRRLAALKLLRSDDLREAIGVTDPDEWDEASESDVIPDVVPVVIAPDRKSVAPIVGYRHISGIEPWDPWAKARFISHLVNDLELDFDDAARLVGERETDIRSHYRNEAVVRQAKEDFDIETERVQSSFGVFTRAMTSLGIRTFVGAPAPAEVEAGKKPLSHDSAERFRELAEWLFGTEEKEAVIQDSRHLTELGTILASETGLQVLREKGDREEAFIAAGGLQDRLLRRLANANGNLEKAAADMELYPGDPEACRQIAACKEALEKLEAVAGCDE